MRMTSIKVGRFYRTPTYQVRYVQSLKAGVVTYVSRGKRVPKPDWWKGNSVGWVSTPIDKFARQVVESVKWYWDPNFPSPEAKKKKPNTTAATKKKSRPRSMMRT